MGTVIVKFLGREYPISEAIKDFFQYDAMLVPELEQLLEMLKDRIRRDTQNPDNAIYFLEEDLNAYSGVMETGAKRLVGELYQRGIYNVTENDLLADGEQRNRIMALQISVGESILDEARKLLEQEKSGMAQVYRSTIDRKQAATPVFFTDNIGLLAVYSLTVGRELKKCAQELDREYQRAIEKILKTSEAALTQACREILTYRYYPQLFELLKGYHQETTVRFMMATALNGKFDFDSIQMYDAKKAESMLEHADLAADKEAFLHHVFQVCPFSLPLYQKCLDYGWMTEELFETAQYFELDVDLMESIQKYISDHLTQKEKISPLIPVLAKNKGMSLAEAWRSVYSTEVERLEKAYQIFPHIITNPERLDQFIRNNFSEDMMVVKDLSQTLVHRVVGECVGNLFRNLQYEDMTSFFPDLPERIRLPGSSATDLSKINDEIVQQLEMAVLKYIVTAQTFYATYQTAKEKFEKEVAFREQEIERLRQEKKEMPLFAFKQKKEIANILIEKRDSLEEFRRTNYPTEKQKQFEKMYSQND